MNHFILKFIFIFLFVTGCATTQHQAEKEIEQCIITMSENNFDSENKINATDLVANFENLLLEQGFLMDRSPKAYRDLYDLINEEKVDSLKLDMILFAAHQKELGIMNSPTLHASEYACVVRVKEEFPKVFEESKSLLGLYNSMMEYKEAMGALETLVVSVTDKVPEAEFREKIVYRLFVITAMYSIMEQTYSRYKNLEQE